MGRMRGVLQAAGDPGDVVIADERLRHKGFEKGVVPLQRPVQLEEIAVVEAAPDRLPQLILGRRVEPRAIDDRRVVAVDQFSDEPGVGMVLADPGQYLSPESLWHGISSIQAPTVGSAVQPVRHHLDDIVGYRGVAVVESDQLRVALEGVAGETSVPIRGHRSGGIPRLRD